MSHSSRDDFWVPDFAQPFSKRQFLDSPKLKEFADDNFEFHENGRKFSKWVENTVGKGEIVSHKQFLLFPHSVFKRLILQTRKNKGLFKKGLIIFRPFFDEHAFIKSKYELLVKKHLAI